VAEHKDLGVLGGAAAGEEHEPRHDSAGHQVDQARRHSCRSRRTYERATHRVPAQPFWRSSRTPQAGPSRIAVRSVRRPRRAAANVTTWRQSRGTDDLLSTSVAALMTCDTASHSVAVMTSSAAARTGATKGRHENLPARHGAVPRTRTCAATSPGHSPRYLRKARCHPITDQCIFWVLAGSIHVGQPGAQRSRRQRNEQQR
jgi:hypothetical protein